MKMIICSFTSLSQRVFTEIKPHKGILAVTTTTTVLLRRRRQTRARTGPLKSSRCHSSCFSVTILRRGYFTQNIVSQQTTDKPCEYAAKREHRKPKEHLQRLTGKRPADRSRRSVATQPARFSGFDGKQWRSLPHSGCGLYS